MKKNGLTIGIPVFNEEKTIERAVRSAAGQCERIIVSDNASTDGTEQVCRKLMGEFSNLHYTRQTTNIGSINNIISIAENTETQFIMVLGGHDYIENGYADAMLPLFFSENGIECVMGSLIFVQDDKGQEEPVRRFNEWHGGEQDSPIKRVWSFFTDGAPIVWATYGIFRTRTFRGVFTKELPLFGPDAIFMATILSIGKLKISNQSSYFASARAKEKNKLNYFERVSGIKHKKNDIDSLFNQYRLQQYEIIKKLYHDDNPVKSALRRFVCMSRFKPFKTKDNDIYFFLLYIPAVVANRLERAVKKIRRQFSR